VVHDQRRDRQRLEDGQQARQAIQPVALLRVEGVHEVDQ
jgi:hypothetical protein